MKTTMKLIVAIVAVLISFSVSSCTDPVWGTKPVDKSYSFNFPLERFHTLGLAGDTTKQKKMIDDYRKQLSKNVLSHFPKITDEKNIHFILGSGLAKKVKSGDGKTYDGKFKNEVIIIINDPSIKDTLFLACGNGMLCPLELTHSSDLGSGSQFRFTIKKGESLCTYLPQLKSWAKVAGDLKIPIRDKKGNIVSKETYLNYLGKYQSVLFTGDVIDMAQMKVFNAAGQEVDFQIRLAETKEANKRLLDKIIEKRIKADIARQKNITSNA
jgi:hypothetical protein